MWPFRKKKTDPLDDIFDGIDEPRENHYVFGHMGIRAYARANPLTFLSLMASEKHEEFLQDVWAEVTEHSESSHLCPSEGQGMKVHCLRIKDYLCNIIELPPAKNVTECYMVALVVMNELDDIGEDTVWDLAYFTLEVGFSFENEDRTVLGGWSMNEGEHAHYNFGDGPPPDVEMFAQAIEAHLEK